jgi:DsbC/DsbD-like thiol-disulfide interchange protein
MSIARLPLLAAATVLLAGTAGAQDPVKWTVKPVAATATAGGQASVKLVATIEDGWHIYSLTQGPGGPTPTKVTLPEGQPFTLGGAIKSADEPDVKFDENFGINIETYERGAEFTIPITVDKATKAGPQKILVNARYMVCNASTCMPTKTAKLSADVSIKAAGKKKA